MTKELIEQNKAIKVEANSILYEKKLLDILHAFGRPSVSGSYALDLMTWRDLDIYLETEEDNEEQFFQLGGALSTALSPTRMQFRNEKIAKTPGLPDGLYWGIYFGDERIDAWKIDIWAVNSTESSRLKNYCDSIKVLLNDELSAVILSIKSQCWQDPDYRRVYTSADIYKAVLRHGVRDLDGFWKYLDKG